MSQLFLKYFKCKTLFWVANFECAVTVRRTLKNRKLDLLCTVYLKNGKRYKTNSKRYKTNSKFFSLGVAYLCTVKNSKNCSSKKHALLKKRKSKKCHYEKRYEKIPTVLNSWGQKKEFFTKI